MKASMVKRWIVRSNAHERFHNQRSTKTKTPSFPQNGNEGIRRVLTKTDRQAGPILLFAEKCSETFGADERCPTGILTAASCLFPPSRPGAVALGIVAVTVAQPSRNLTGFP